jgi:hypothetical protein
LAGSLAVLTHEPLQAASPAAQVATQVPSEQTSLAAQACPQVPQFFTSSTRSTQTEGATQATVPVGHEHWPALQVVPPLQVVPQAPQFCGLDWVSRHAPEQLVSPVPQAEAQVP